MNSKYYKENISFREVILFVLPTYFTSLFTTMYTIVDGVCVAAWVDTDALASINIVYPLINILTGIGMMFGIGGSALAAVSLGSGNSKKAGQQCTISALYAFILSGVFAGACIWKLETWLQFLGATPSTVTNCEIYAKIWLFGASIAVGKDLIVAYIRADGAPKKAFFISAAGGITNIILDILFVGLFKWGIFGAGLATIIGLAASMILGILYFTKGKNQISFSVSGLSLKEGLTCAVNGSSEFVDQAAIAVTTVVFNRTALSFAGKNGVAAVSIIMYLQFIFLGIYYGYSSGILPLMSFELGRKNFTACRCLEQYSYRLVSLLPIVLYCASYFFAPPLAVGIFVNHETEVFIMAVRGMRIYGLGYLFAGINIFCTIRLIAYEWGRWAAVITSLRSFSLLLLFLTILPTTSLGMDGLWLAFPAAEAGTLAVAVLISQYSSKRLHVL